MRAARGLRFATVRTEGAILPPDLLARVRDGDASLGGLQPGDYHLDPGEKLNERISRTWNRLLGTWASFKSQRAKLGGGDSGTSTTRERWLLPLFDALGYGRLQATRAIELNGKSYPISHAWGPVPIHLVGINVDLDHRMPGVAGAARMSPHGMVQELLNRSEDHLWAILSNGLKLRVLRDNTSLTRQAYVEFDLESMFEGEAYADFALLWLVCHQSRVEGEKLQDFWLEKWSQAAQQQGARALDQLRDGVEAAISILGAGFLACPGNGMLRQRLRDGSLDKQDYYRQVLRLVYRLIFLFVAEDRDLLFDPSSEPAVRGLYIEHYSTGRLRRLAERRRGTRHGDLYRGLQIVMEKLGEEAGCPELGLPGLGSFLWSAEATPDLAKCKLGNRELLEAIRSLAFTQQGNVRRAVDYKNLGPEELGSVYESLLELQPEVNTEAATFNLKVVEGSERRTTGSYYTATSLVSCLLDSALDPVVEEALKAENPEAALLDLKVCDPACGSGHFLVAAAHRIARQLASVRTGDAEPSPKATRSALRDVISHCTYGVDISPMAVELCKVNLWLEAIEPGKPLSFLDHHIRVGNSLFGATPELIAAGLPDETFAPIEGDDKKACAILKKRNRAERKGLGPLFAQQDADAQARLQQAAADLEELPDDRLEDIRAKGLAFQNHEKTEQYREKKWLADAWCAAFFIKKQFREPGREASARGITQAHLNDLASGRTLSAELTAEVEDLSGQYRFFHWHLAFPEVFREGGFDCVIGNPPWLSLVGRFSADETDRRSTQFGIIRHRSNTYMPNTYEMFVRLALELVRQSGFAALLLPDRVAFNFHLQPLREQILKKTSIASLTFKVPFPDVTVDVLAFVTCLSEPSRDHEIPIREWGGNALAHNQAAMLKHPACAFEYSTNSIVKGLMAQIDNHQQIRRLAQICETTSGFGGRSQQITSERKSPAQIEVLKGESICRFGVRRSFWFEFIRENITGRTTDRQKLGAIPKILLRKTGDSIIATLDETGRFPEQSLYFLFNFAPTLAPKYLLGLLNSRLLGYYYRKRCLTNPDSIAQAKKTDLDALPIVVPSQNSQADLKEQQTIVQSVDRLLLQNEAENDVELRSVDERAIDAAVYRLYQLTEEQIATVEADSGPYAVPA